MYGRFKIVGLGLIVAGFVFVGVGGYTYVKTLEGATALKLPSWVWSSSSPAPASSGPPDR